MLEPKNRVSEFGITAFLQGQFRINVSPGLKLNTSVPLTLPLSLPEVRLRYLRFMRQNQHLADASIHT